MWIFLAGLKMALNLSHYLFATVAAERDQTVITLFPVSKGDSITVSDPGDVATLRRVFESRGLTELSLIDPPSPPPPAEAASDVTIAPPKSVDAPANSSNPPASDPPPQTGTDPGVAAGEQSPPQTGEANTSNPTAEDQPDQGEAAAADQTPAAVAEPEKPSSPFLGRR